MVSVNWKTGDGCNYFSITKKTKISCPRSSHLWTDLVKPKTISQIYGNPGPVDAVRDWFLKRQFDSLSSCLFIHGVSGVGKSSVVDIMANLHGFTTVHTYADSQRTPAKIESSMRETSLYGESGVLVLDDFEIFLKETSFIKYLLKLLQQTRSTRLLVIIICNAVDRSFLPIKNISESVEFFPLKPASIYKILSRVSVKVRDFCYIPSMAIHMVSNGSSGNAMQTMNQMQFMYAGTKDPYLFRRSKKKMRLNKLQPVDGVSKRDPSTKMWTTTYRGSSVEYFLGDPTILDSVLDMNRNFIDNLGVNIHKEYLYYFHNGMKDSLDSISSVMNSLSFADICRPEDHEDRLYSGENENRWTEDYLNFAIGVHGCLKLLEERVRVEKKMKMKMNRHKRELFVM